MCNKLLLKSIVVCFLYFDYKRMLQLSTPIIVYEVWRSQCWLGRQLQSVTADVIDTDQLIMHIPQVISQYDIWGQSRNKLQSKIIICYCSIVAFRLVSYG